ncbi:MAG: ATP-binding protein [Hyphomicrobiales bacterium]|nr:ATP-binding protein [Hyphomicrobiales bacterium]
MIRLWPKKLASRLVILLVSALAVAQVVIIFVLHDEQRIVGETMAHGQALNQVVTLARLLSHYPKEQANDLAAAFGSRTTCATVETSAPGAIRREAGAAEAQLAETLGRMLHGADAGEPSVILRRFDTEETPCGGRPPEGPIHFHGDGAPPMQPAGAYSAELVVPLGDGRTLRYVSVIDTPMIPFRVIAISFVLVAFAVSTVAVVSVRHQTRSLRDLADAAERLGRGEDAPPLSDRGPAEIAVAIHAFETMRARLRRYMSERLRLLAAISHDLRTPLTTLRLKAEFVEDEAVRDDLVATVDELTAITEATLAFTRAEASHEETRRIALDELVGEVVSDFRLAGAVASLDTPHPVPFEGRPVTLKRAVRNIVENAIRYGGSARVTILDDEDRVRIVVEDDGPGLPAERVDEAFQPFVRLEPSRNRETGGLGLGLSIARGIVQNHGGAITLTNREVADREVRGLRVEIGLPRRRA